MLLKNCSIWIKDRIVKGHILINKETGTIEHISVTNLFGKSDSDSQIDLDYKLVIPSLIDIHTHLRDFNEEYKETYRTAAIAAAAGGFTTVFDMPNKVPPINNSKRLKEVQEKIKNIFEVEIIPYILLDNINELDIVQKYPYFKAYFGPTTGNNITDINNIKRFLNESHGSILSVHCEDEARIKINTQKYLNILENHPKIRDAQVELIAINNLVSIQKNNVSSVKLHVAHVTLQESIKILQINNISFEVTPHHLLFNNRDFKRIGVTSKMNPPLRSVTEQKKLLELFFKGKIPIIATDHAPHSLEDKLENSLSGIPGLETCLPLLLDRNRPITETRLKLIVNALAINPRRLMNLPDKGIIAKGEIANLTVIDLKKEKKIKGVELKTKCKWSPWEGLELRGWPVMTIRNGYITFDELDE